MHVDYTGLRTTNLARSKRLLEKGLGLEEVRRGKMAHGGVWVLFEDRVSHQRIELNWYPRGSPYATEFVPGEGLDHIGVRVQTLAAAGQRLKAAGAKRVHEIRWRGKAALEYWEGPDGLWVELILDPAE